MIKIAGTEADMSVLLGKYPRDSVERNFLEIISESSKVYEYSSMSELIFETDLRGGIVRASLRLYRGRLRFSTFHESKCNEAYWNRDEDGGFTLREGVPASTGINDIFINTRKYATECATAVVIIFYAAVLEVYSASLFNIAFKEITLMNWTKMDELMGIATYRKVKDPLPGDCRYFRNPEVNPATPEWQGENAVLLDEDTYFGHGIGIGSKEKIIRALNANRIEDAEVSAYLMDTATRPNFSNLYNYKKHAVPVIEAASDPAPAHTPAASTSTTTTAPAHSPAAPVASPSAPAPATAAAPAHTPAATATTPIPAPTSTAAPASTPAPAPTTATATATTPTPAPTSTAAPATTPAPAPTTAAATATTPIPAPTSTAAPATTPAPAPTTAAVPATTPAPAPTTAAVPATTPAPAPTTAAVPATTPAAPASAAAPISVPAPIPPVPSAVTVPAPARSPTVPPA